MADHFDVLIDDEIRLLGTLDNVFVAVWRQPPTVPLMADLNERLSLFADMNPGGIFGLTVIEPAVGVVEGEARDESVRGLRCVAGRLQSVALVVLSDGFKGSIIRSIIAAIGIVVQEPWKTKVFSDVKQAALWLGEERSKTGGEPLEMQNLIANAGILRGT